MNLEELRERINTADDQLIRAFDGRMRAARDIAEYKRARHLLIYDPAREQAVAARQAAAVDKIIAPYAKALYSTLFSLSRSYQRRLMMDMKYNSGTADEAGMNAELPNLVLIGMPGCGKSTIGRLVARRLDLPLVDIDEALERESGRSIPELFALEGEASFRERETAFISRLTLTSGLVIATGGGAVLSGANRDALRLNGFVVHLVRRLALLETNGRPLSQGEGALKALWHARAPLYAACAECVIGNNNMPEDCADAVIREYTRRRSR